MNKKFLSAILFGALMVTSTGTFVSCKDYDDDIQNVQEQVDANKSALAALTSQATALQGALDAAKSTAEAAKTAAAEAKKAGDDALAAAKAAEAAAADAKAEAIAEAQKQVDTLKAWVEGQDYVTEEEMSAAIAVVTGRINGIEEALGESLKNLVAADQVALTNIVALQEDLELQKAALEKYQAYVDELYVEIGGEAGLRAQLGQVTNVVTDMQQQLDELWAEIGGEAGLGSTTGTLASAIQALQEELVNLAERDNALEGNINEITQYVSNLIEAQDGNESAIEELWAEINGEGANSIRTQMGQLAGLVGEIQGNLATVHTLLNNMITSVSLWEAQSITEKRLNLYNVIEKDAVFGDKTAIKANENITFTEGKLVQYDDCLTIRVSPTNAVVKKEQISLINTKGENLNDYLEVVEVKAYDELLLGSVKTRNAEKKSGLWKVYFKLKDNVDPAQFDEEVATAKKYNRDWYVRFAVAVKNAETEANVISGYNVEVATKAAIASKELDFYANDQKIEVIKNRYQRAEDRTSTWDVEELWWNIENEKIETPAVAPILEGLDKNVILKQEGFGYDDRTWNQFLPVVKGEPITININSWKDVDDNFHVNEGGKIAGFYVTLDKAYAVESTPSEINAWNSYEYENVGTDKQAATMIKGNSGTITIKDLNNVSGDIIGFRVYAVNLDGTLVDPDGRAFYVAIGDVAKTEVVKATIVPVSMEQNTAYAELTDAQKEIIRSLKKDQEAINWNLEMDYNNNPKVQGYSAGYNVEFVKDAEGTQATKAEDINFVKFILNDNIAMYLDNGTYKAKQEIKNNRGNILGVIEYELTKELPTTLPAVFSAKEQQIISDLYTCYLQPTTQNWEVGETPAEVGYMDLGSVFNGLVDENGELLTTIEVNGAQLYYSNTYKFIFATSKQKIENNGDIKLVDNLIEAYAPASYYQLQVTPAVEFINAGEEHATKVIYTYEGISTYQDKEGNWKIGVDHDVTWDYQFDTKYACWHQVQTWSVIKPANYAITYAAEEKTVDLANIKGVNSYNNTLFGEGADKKQTLKDLVEKSYLKINDAYLTSNENNQEEYFDITVDGNTLTFVPLKDDVQSNPKAAVASTLTIVCEDCFGCEVKIAVPYTVNKQ